MRNLRRSDVKVRRLLDGARTIAVIGASRRRSDRSWTAVDYLRRNGFDVVPVRDDQAPVSGLQIAREVDEDIAADDHVDVRQRRVLHDVVLPEDAPAPDVAPEPERLALACEVLLEQRCRDVLEIFRPIQAVAAGLQRLFVHVGGVDADVEIGRRVAEVLGDQHRDRIRLFARRAPGGPDAKAPRLAGFGDERRYHVLREGFPGVGVAEEPRDVDEDRVDRRVGETRRSAADGVLDRDEGDDRRGPCAPRHRRDERRDADALTIALHALDLLPARARAGGTAVGGGRRRPMAGDQGADVDADEVRRPVVAEHPRHRAIRELQHVMAVDAEPVRGAVDHFAVVGLARAVLRHVADPMKSFGERAAAASGTTRAS